MKSINYPQSEVYKIVSEVNGYLIGQSKKYPTITAKGKTIKELESNLDNQLAIFLGGTTLQNE